MFYQYTRKEKKKKLGRFLFSLRFGPSAANPLYTLPSFPAIRPRPSQSRRPAKEPDSRGTHAASPTPPQKKTLECISAALHFSPSSREWMQPPRSPPPLPKESTPTHSDTSTPLMAFEKLPFKPSKVLQPTQTTDGSSSRVQVLVHAANVTFSRHCIHLQRYNVLPKKNEMSSSRIAQPLHHPTPQQPVSKHSVAFHQRDV